MKIDGFIQTNSDYLTKADCDPAILVTIAGATIEKLGDDEKIIIHFNELEKGLATNKINLKLMEAFYKSSDTDDWVGKKIVLWDDVSVMYAGKVVGGIRVRLPVQQPVAPAVPVAPVPAAPAADFIDSDVPF